MSATNELDQFFTDKSVAQNCYTKVREFAELVGIKDPFFIEPSAGSGAFYDLLPEDRRIGFDLEPRHQEIIQQDFFDWRVSHASNIPSRGQRIVIGNPPFGYRGDLATGFLNQSSVFSDIVGFILPACFTKYSVQKFIQSDLRLVHQSPIRRNGFHLPNGKSYSVNTVFQIWTKLNILDDLRRKEKPKIRHNDFRFNQYNNTPQSSWMFDVDFDVAVPCQGWQDYSRRETESDMCERNKQWMFFYAEDEIIKRIVDFDFDELAHKNATSVPGFRKNDFVEAYTNVYGS